MGITFGDKAQVDVGGDMVGGDKVLNVYLAAARQVRDVPGVPLPNKTEAVQAISTIRREMHKEEPSSSVLEMAASSIAQAAPDVLQTLVSAIPAIMQAAPGIARLLG